MKRRIFFAIALSFCLSFLGAFGARAQTTDAEAATSLVRQALLAASDGQEGERFGQGVALDGDMLVVGASQATVNGNERQGAAYVFQKTVRFGQMQSKLQNSRRRTATDSIILDGAWRFKVTQLSSADITAQRHTFSSNPKTVGST